MVFCASCMYVRLLMFMLTDLQCTYHWLLYSVRNHPRPVPTISQLPNISIQAYPLLPFHVSIFVVNGIAGLSSGNCGYGTHNACVSQLHKLVVTSVCHTQSVAEEKEVFRGHRISQGWWQRFHQRQNDLGLRRGDNTAYVRIMSKQ